MDIPTDQRKQGLVKPEVLATSFNVRQMKVSSSVVIWCLFFLVVAVELYAVYLHLYLNLVVRDTSANNTSSASVRINFENYDKATKRLNSVAQYHILPSIDFSGPAPSVGRDNPFSDPQ